MTCAGCVSYLEGKLSVLPWVRSVAINLVTEEGKFEIISTLETLVKQIISLGYTARQIIGEPNAVQVKHTHVPPLRTKYSQTASSSTVLC